MIFLVAIFYALVMFLAVAANITRIPWDTNTVAMLVAFVLGCTILWRNRRIGALLLFFAASMAEIAINRIPSPPGTYSSVPPSNTLVIPKKD